MDVTVLQADLEPELKAIKGIAERMLHTIPILSHVRLTARDDRLFIDATDIEQWMHTSCAATVLKPGAEAAPAKLLRQMVEHITFQTIHLRTEKGARLEVTADQYQAHVNALDVKDYPVPHDRAGDLMDSHVPSAALRHLFKSGLWAIDADQTHTANAIIERTETETRVMTTNTHVLVSVTSPPWDGTGATKLKLSGHSVQAILALVAEEDIVNVQLKEQRCFFNAGHRTLVVRPAEAADIPGIPLLLALPFQDVVTLKRAELLGAMERLIKTMDKDTRSVLVRIAANELTLVYDRETQMEKPEKGKKDGSAAPLGRFETRDSSEGIEVKYDGPEVTFKVKGTYLRDAAYHSGEMVTIGRTKKKNDPVRLSSLTDLGTFQCVIAVMK